MENFFSNVNITYKDISSGVIAHNSKGDVIIGYPLKTLDEEIKKSKIENSKLIYRNGSMGINVFQKFNTQKSTFSSSIRNGLYGAIKNGVDDFITNIEEFYAHNLISIPTSDFFSGCANLKKVYLPACHSVKEGCFLFSNKKTDFYLLGASVGMLSAGFQYSGAFIGSALALCVNKIYVPSSYYTAWYANNTLRAFVEVYSGL